MPKATKPHYQKKDPAAHEAWMQRKANRINLVGKASGFGQKYWRFECLRVRNLEGRLTDNNKKEILALLDNKAFTANERILLQAAQ